MNERILIIEDDQAILKLLQRGLAYEGYTVDTATEGRSGLSLARDHQPDMVILDWMLPGMDGLEVCHRLRMGGKVPILMLTAKDCHPGPGTGTGCRGGRLHGQALRPRRAAGTGPRTAAPHADRADRRSSNLQT